jgi:pyridoxine/pyridoxamine 5'-phosphate oxidase
MAGIETEFPDSQTIPVAPNAKGLLLSPDEIDLWHGVERFPERTLFTRQGNAWSEKSLAP